MFSFHLLALVVLQHTARLEGSVDSLMISGFAMNPKETVDVGAEVSDGEEVPPTVPEESRVEEVFAEVEQRGGLAWRQRGILPLLVVSIFSWGIKFPTVPTEVRGAAADSLCDLAPRVKSLWNKGACAFSDFLRDTRRASIVFNSFSTGCGRGYISQWLKRYGKDRLLSFLTVRDWKLALAVWRKFQVQVSLNPAISLSRTETSVRSFLSRSDILEHFEAFVNYGFNLEAHLPVPKLELSAKSRRKKNRLLANLEKGI